MSANAPPSARIAPLQSFIRHWRISAVVAFLIVLAGVVDVNYPDRSATTILAGGSGE